MNSYIPWSGSPTMVNQAAVAKVRRALQSTARGGTIGFGAIAPELNGFAAIAPELQGLGYPHAGWGEYLLSGLGQDPGEPPPPVSVPAINWWHIAAGVAVGGLAVWFFIK